MIHYAEILRPDKTVSHTVPMAHYTINQYQYIAAVANYRASIDDPAPEDGVSWQNIGPLDELGWMMQSLLRNSMESDGWDFEAYPNPQVFLGERMEGDDDD